MSTTVANIDIQLQSLVLGGVVIAPHGEGASPRIDFDPAGEMARGIATDIRIKKNNQGAVLICSMFKEEVAFGQLLELYQGQKFTSPPPALPGSMIDASSGRRVVWDDAFFTDTPSMVMGESAESVTFTIALSGARYVS